MFGKYFSKKKKDKFYLPGEEIKIDKSISFHRGLTCSNNDPLAICRGRMFYAVAAFATVYLVIAVNLFNLCIAPNLKQDKPTRKTAEIQSPIKRADIIDRNGTIIATSLPTVNLYANPLKILDPENAAHELASILPELKFDDILQKNR